MSKGESMDTALKRAQAAGIAEADPSGDLKGMDAAVKLVALTIALELGGADVTPDDGGGSGGGGGGGGGEEVVLPRLRLGDVDIGGIMHVTTEMATAATARGNKLRLVACAQIVGDVDGDDDGGSDGTTKAVQPQSPQISPDLPRSSPPAWVPLAQRRQQRAPGSSSGALTTRRVRAYTRVEELEPGDPLFGLDDADNAVMFVTDRLAPVTIAQKGSEVTDTAFGEFADMLRAVRPLPP